MFVLNKSHLTAVDRVLTCVGFQASTQGSIYKPVLTGLNNSLVGGWGVKRGDEVKPVIKIYIYISNDNADLKVKILYKYITHHKGFDSIRALVA